MRAIAGVIATMIVLQAGPAAADEGLADRERAASAATGAFMKELGGALKRELADGTPASAIQICSDIAPGIANRISLENGWRVTRVGTRVRNPMLGTPDAWEQQVLREFAERAASGEALAQMKYAEVVEEPGGSYYRYMKAIGVKPECLACHGAPDEVGQPVADALAQRYPFDRATGYRKGDLRGAISIKQPLDLPLR